jgi:hypothetical protein
MKQLLLCLLLLGPVLAQTGSKVLGQNLPLDGAAALKAPEERILRALSVTEGKRCQVFEGWSFKAATASEYSKLIEASYVRIKAAGWKLEPKGQLSQGGSNVEAFKLIGAKNEQVLAYWLLAGGATQLIWCRLG